MSPFLGFTKKLSWLPRVVWAEESTTGLGFEIGSSYDDIPTASQFLADGKSSCSYTCVTHVAKHQNAVTT